MTQDQLPNTARRAAMTLTMFLGIFFLTAVPLLALFGFQVVTILIPLVAAITVARYTWVRTNEILKYRVSFIFYGAVLFGGLGFAGGFWGPMIFAPGANQGPLLGIFITGPAGGLIGALLGLVYGFVKSKRDSH